MKRLNEDLKTGNFSRVYLLYGEESYLKRIYRDRFIKALSQEGDTMNCTRFEGKNTDPKAVIDLAETMPFFAEKRLIVLEETTFFKGSSPELAAYLKEMPETTCMLFVESEVDKRGRLYKAVNSIGRAVELGMQDERTLMRWLAGLAGKKGMQMETEAASLLLFQAGHDMGQLENEVEKLSCYAMDRKAITAEDVRRLGSVQVTNQIFDMVDAVAAKRQKKALDLYYNLLMLKEQPMTILALLNRQFRLLMEIKEMERLGYGPKEMASKSGLMPFLVGRYRAQAKAFKRRELRAVVEEGVDVEEQLKSGRMDGQLAVELFLVKYSQPGNAGQRQGS